MSGHTPGPWSIEPKPYSQFYIQITGSDLKTIASLHAGGLRNRPLEHGNARLIAAAPDLLEELDNCADLLNLSFPDAPVDSCIGVAIIKARAAIAKAIGVAA
jgi:hypothetical protein